jgi:hypothetical protein
LYALCGICLESLVCSFFEFPWVVEHPAAPRKHAVVMDNERRRPIHFFIFVKGELTVEI